MAVEAPVISGDENGFFVPTDVAAPDSTGVEAAAVASGAASDRFMAQTGFDPRALARPELMCGERSVVVRVAAGSVRPVLSTGGGFGAALGGPGRDGIGECGVPLFELADLDQPPAVVSQPLPRYPAELARSGANGEVLLSFIVDAEGVVRCPRVVESSRPEFRTPALQAVRWWKFRPGRKDGRRVATRVEAPIAFAMPDART